MGKYKGMNKKDYVRGQGKASKENIQINDTGKHYGKSKVKDDCAGLLAVWIRSADQREGFEKWSFKINFDPLI